MIGSKGTTEVDGATLRGRFGLFDTWAYFTAITSDSTAPPATPPAPEPTPAPKTIGPSPSPSGNATAGTSAVGALTSTVIPAKRGAVLQVQVRRGSRWIGAG